MSHVSSMPLPSTAPSAHAARWAFLSTPARPRACLTRRPTSAIHSAAAATTTTTSSTNTSAPPGATTTVLITAPAAPATATATPTPVTYTYHQLEVPQTPPGIALVDITPQLRELVSQTALQEGCVHVMSRHTTTALTINENEARLLDDVRQFLSRLAPAGDPYLHNDLHLRPAPEHWPGGWAAWAAQEPRNAHSHLLSMLLGNTLTVPVTGGRLALGTWQSVLFVELDGPRPRSVGVQLVGHRAPEAEHLGPASPAQ